MRKEILSGLAFCSSVAVAVVGCEPQTFNKDTGTVNGDDTAETGDDDPADVDDPDGTSTGHTQRLEHRVLGRSHRLPQWHPT